MAVSAAFRVVGEHKFAYLKEFEMWAGVQGGAFDVYEMVHEKVTTAEQRTHSLNNESRHLMREKSTDGNSAALIAGAV